MSDRDRFDKFTERARKVLSLAQEEAQRLRHNYIGVEHILLGLVRESDGIAGRVLLKLGVDLPKLREAVAQVSSSEQAIPNQIGLTAAGKQAIEMAVEEAYSLNHHFIGTEHLLLGLIHQRDKTFVAIFDLLGVKLEDVSNQAADVLSQRSSPLQSNLPPFGNRLDRFANFSPAMRKVMSLAQEEAQRLQHNYIAVEHLLLGLLRQPEGLAAQVLRDLGPVLDQARSTAEFISGRGDRIVLGEIGLTPRAKGIIDLARDEAYLLNSPTIETEHLLLTLIRERDGIAFSILDTLGVKRAAIYTRVLHLLSQEIAERDTAPEQREPATSQPHQADADEMEPPTLTPEDMVTIQSIIQGLSADSSYGTDRFSEQFRSALAFAVEEARRFQHNYIGTEHLLLGLTRESDGPAVRVLARLGVRLERVRGSVEFIIGRGDRMVAGNIGLTPRSKKVIELATVEALRLNQQAIGSEHLLLGLVAEGEGIAAGILESLGVNLTKVRAQVLREMGR